ncbi:VacJ family lipoprotein [Pseudomonas fluorescens]|uniref:MlaA family lipoprotein n=1 Tax=Pseudomonas fluorescens TaxID=294 RepID=UPI001781EB6E|nr:VacJ family lipoprotein [Pseudomonas fluorescens]MBD8194837.1 VacJ family lipoprotein [Pseudomonas fluorescens]MBD8229763.1 VacJ family lipoprotein [Pseudomonas fluorescens]MBD8787581.1 VacJ family lipoprotein [Pseudomonas fluorescens]MBD8820089.1 VacJ family lipoprotein [Pseudomonas fluorescens]
MRALTYPHHLARQAVLLLTVSYLAGCANPTKAPSTRCAQVNYPVHDLAERVNRSMFAFNRAVDNYALAPVARGYRYLPEFFQQGVHNFASNFSEPKVFINDLLQGNPRRSVNTLGRFAVNTTVGVVGLIDVSDRLGIPRHSADFGQTFGGKVLSFLVSPLGDSDTVQTLGTISLVGGTVDTRASLLPLTDSLQKLPDYYSALRNVVAQNRAAFVLEGKEGATSPASEGCAKGAADDF